MVRTVEATIWGGRTGSREYRNSVSLMVPPCSLSPEASPMVIALPISADLGTDHISDPSILRLVKVGSVANSHSCVDPSVTTGVVIVFSETLPRPSGAVTMIPATVSWTLRFPEFMTTRYGAVRYVMASIVRRWERNSCQLPGVPTMAMHLAPLWV